MKGATEMDKSAHKLMGFWNSKSAETYDDSRYKATYHEERLYSVYDVEREQVTLVYADNPNEAIREVRVKGTTINVKQIGGNSKVIGYVENMTV